MTTCGAVCLPPRPLSVGLQLVVSVQPLAGCVDRGVELEVEVTGEVLHVGGEGGCLLLLGVQLQEGPGEEKDIVLCTPLQSLQIHTATPPSNKSFLFLLVQPFQSPD